MIKNYYKILEVNVNCSNEEIKKSFKKLALFWHPDRNGNENAILKMQELNEAYSILSDSEKRKTYDIVYKQLFITQPNINKYNTKSDYNEKYDNLKKEHEKEINELNNWIKNIKFSLKSFESLLDKGINVIDRPIENFAYYLPYVIALAFILFVIYGLSQS